MSISNIIDAGTKQIFPPLIPQSAVGVLSITGQAPITIGGTTQNPVVSLGAGNATNGVAVFTVSPASTQNTLSGGIGPLVQFSFASLISSSGIGSSFSVSGGEVIWGGTSDIAITFTVPITFNTTQTSGGATEEFTSVAPLDGGLPASGTNPPYLNLYTHSGLVFVFQTLNAQDNVLFEIAQGCASGFLVNIGEYSANITYTTVMKPTDKIKMNVYSNSAFNQNWNGGPNAGTYTITATSLPVLIYAVECPLP